MAGEMTAGTLNTLHNLHFYLDTMKRIREAIVFAHTGGTQAELPPDLSRQPGDPHNYDRNAMSSRRSRWARAPGPGVNP